MCAPYHLQFPGIQTQRRPFQRQRPRDQCQRWGPRGGGGRTSRRGGGIGGMAHDGDTAEETPRENGSAAAADAVTDRVDAPEARHAMAASAAANILLRSSIPTSFRTEHCPIWGCGVRCWQRCVPFPVVFLRRPRPWSLVAHRSENHVVSRAMLSEIRLSPRNRRKQPRAFAVIACWCGRARRQRGPPDVALPPVDIRFIWLGLACIDPPGADGAP